MAKDSSRRPKRNAEDISPLNLEQKRILVWLKRVRFKKKMFGGVSERDVWKKIEELNNMYNAALNAERVRYDALLEQKRAGVDTEFRNGGGE